MTCIHKGNDPRELIQHQVILWLIHKENDIPIIKVRMGLMIPTLKHIWLDPPSGFTFGWVWPNVPLSGNCETHPFFYQGNVLDPAVTYWAWPFPTGTYLACPQPTGTYRACSHQTGTYWGCPHSTGSYLACPYTTILATLPPILGGCPLIGVFWSKSSNLPPIFLKNPLFFSDYSYLTINYWSA